MALSPPLQTAESTLFSGAVAFVSNITAGNGVVVFVSVSGGTVTLSAGGETYTPVTLVSTFLYAFYISSSAGGYKTFTASSGATIYAAVAYEIPSAITLDNSSGAGGGPSASWSSGSFTSTVAAEIWLGAVQTNANLPTGPSGWTELTAIHSSGQAYILSGWKAAAATGTVAYSGTVTSDFYSAGVLAFHSSSAAHPAAAALSGTGAITAARLVTQPAAAALSGSGSVTAAGTATTLASAALVGLGFVTAGVTVTVPGQGNAALSGTGALGVSRAVTWQQAAPLAGSGTVAAGQAGVIQQAADLSGAGTLGVASAAALKFTAGLFGAGFLSIPQVAGGLVNGVGGGGTPLALPGSSQVAVAPPGSSNWQWLGTLGQVTALTYSYVCPGGADKMTCAVMVPASYRTQLFNPGWQVKITRGGHQVWDGKLDEPQPSASGWTLTAVGNGNRGTDYTAYYTGTPWPNGQPDEIINRAIARGLPWTNPGLNASPYFSQMWFGQQVDPGAQTVTALLNLITSRGALTWYVNSQPGGLYTGDDLNVFPLPTVPNRLLVCTTPVARTLGSDVNTIFIRFMSQSDNTSTNTAATYSTVTAVNSQSVAAHGTLEAFFDLSDAGQLTSTAALTVGNSVLAAYQRASFAGPFQASYGQLLNTGGAPVDPGCDQAGNVVRMLLYDYGLGGEVVTGPITWIVGAYSWNDFSQQATLTPLQVLDQSLSSLLSAANSALLPVTVAGG